MGDLYGDIWVMLQRIFRLIGLLMGASSVFGGSFVKVGYYLLLVNDSTGRQDSMNEVVLILGGGLYLLHGFS